MRNIIVAIRRAWRKWSDPEPPELPPMCSALARPGSVGRTPINPLQRTAEVTGRVVRS